MTEHIKQSSCYIRALVFISGALASKADRWMLQIYKKLQRMKFRK